MRSQTCILRLFWWKETETTNGVAPVKLLMFLLFDLRKKLSKLYFQAFPFISVTLWPHSKTNVVQIDENCENYIYAEKLAKHLEICFMINGALD